MNIYTIKKSFKSIIVCDPFPSRFSGSVWTFLHEFINFLFSSWVRDSSWYEREALLCGTGLWVRDDVLCKVICYREELWTSWWTNSDYWQWKVPLSRVPVSAFFLRWVMYPTRSKISSIDNLKKTSMMQWCCLLHLL